jgi:ethanolamine transporter EutH
MYKPSLQADDSLQKQYNGKAIPLTFTVRASYRLGRHLTFTGRNVHLL